ncbi:chromosome segregation protein [Flavobacteriales bacterium 33_180_T64]|nr:chromosome segregation protein [Flavobacteriales bacterium 33_180_T64]
MSENDNLQDADGKIELNATETPQLEEGENTSTEPISEEIKVANETTNDIVETTELVSEEIKENTTIPLVKDPENTDTHVEEIEESNAEDAEDETNAERHELESKDYHAMSMEQLTLELEQLIENYKIQNIRSQVDEIKSEFNSKFEALLDEKKEEFLSEGGNEIDFYYTSNAKKQFNNAYKTYRNTLSTYYKERENNLKSNLDNRLKIIEEIKGLINVEENINTTYKHFKDLQEQWRNAGPIPRDRYNNAWNSYHHHVEIFYDFLHLNRDLRDMDFKHNLDQKTKIIERAEELAKDDNINRSFRELQVLHKLWKEDLGPVAKEHREGIWGRFSNATKTIHDKRQAYYADLDKARESNLERKEDIISKIEVIAANTSNVHQAWQKKIKSIEALREEFFNAGKVPQKVNEATWSKFKGAVRNFNRNKNAFYKNLKKDQYDNLEKKKALIQIALDNKDNDNFGSTTPLMKKIQSDWKKIGHVPRRDSDKIWKEFKGACNAYFEKVHAERNEADKELMVAYEQKTVLLDEVKTLELSGKPENDIITIKEKIAAWKTIGHVPSNKRYIDGKFNKALDGLFGKLDMDKTKLEMIKFENKLDSLSNSNDTRLLDNEQNFIRKRITEIRGEINQLENNMQFFSNVDESNPLVRDVINNIEKQKNGLTIWEEKLKKIRSIY